ncbi:serine-rich adhesin for platelets-like [Haliotis asinina]|uniref:serine-rich adhesin for platelets-like n=1 Tax=Haliotis asinina TaxID=109174 RepID=UPI00353255FF
MIEKRTCFAVCSLLYLMSVDGYPIYGELSVYVSDTQTTWEQAKAECQKGGLRLTNYLTVITLGHIKADRDYWVGGKKDNEMKCPVLSNHTQTTDGCNKEHYFLCSPKELADMNHVIMIAVGTFTIINMILVTICVLRRLRKRQARLLKKEKPTESSKKDKKERKKKDKRQRKDEKVSEKAKQEPPAADDTQAPKQTGDDAQTVQTTAVVEAGATGTAGTGTAATGTANMDTASTTPAGAPAPTAVDTEDGKEEELPDPPEFILNDTTSAATTTVTNVSTAVAAVTSTATTVSTATGTGAADTGIVSSSITTTETNVDAAKEVVNTDMSCQEARKGDPKETVVTTGEDKPSLMAEMEAMLLGQSSGNNPGEATPMEPPLPPPPEECLKSDTTTET